MKIRLPFLVHPSKAEYRRDVLKQDICERVRPLVWDAVPDSTDSAHVEQVKSWIASHTVDILQSTPRLLAHFEPGFADQKAQDVFAELKKMTKRQGRVLSELQKTEQAVSAQLAIQANNLDPARVSENRKALKAQREALEDKQIETETGKRGIEFQWSKLFQSLKDFQRAQVEAVRQEAIPAVEKFNTEIKAAYQLFVQRIAPKLRQLNEMNPAIPGAIYFTHLHLTDLQVRQLKCLEAFPQIKATGNRFEFQLEVLQYGKK